MTTPITPLKKPNDPAYISIFEIELVRNRAPAAGVMSNAAIKTTPTACTPIATVTTVMSAKNDLRKEVLNPSPLA